MNKVEKLKEKLEEIQDLRVSLRAAEDEARGMVRDMQNDDLFQVLTRAENLGITTYTWESSY